MSDWGKGAVNNNIGWGQGSVNNTIGWGAVYEVSESGDTDIVGLLPETRLVFSVKTDNAGTSGTNQFTIPTTGSGYSYDIETSDGQTITGLTSGTTITFPSAGTYDVFITGAFPRFYFNNGGDKLKLIELKNFGTYAQGSTSQSNAFFGCSNLVISATDTGYFGSVTSFANAWQGCSSLTSFPLIDTSSVTNFNNAWLGCSSLTSFPLLDTSSGTSFQNAWRNCSSLVTFPANAFDSNIATNYSNAFGNTNLSTQSIDDILVSLDVSGVSNGTFTQSGGQGRSYVSNNAVSNLIAKGWTLTLTAPVVDNRVIFSVKTDNAGTSGTNQFTIPTTGTGYSYDIETSDGQTITGLTSGTTITFPSAGTYDVFITGAFPRFYFNDGGDKLKLIELKNFGTYAQGSTSQRGAFWGCYNLVISATDTGYFGSVTDFYATWYGCSSLTSFPLLDTSSGTNFPFAWFNCSSLTSFPLLDTSSGTNFQGAWRNCSSLTSFPLIDTSSGSNFIYAWFGCSSLTSFPLLDTSSVTDFNQAWYNCSSLVTFPANAFDSNIASNYTNAFASTNLSTQSIDDILVSLDVSGVSNGTFTQSGGQGRSYVSNNAFNNLIAKGWTLTLTAPVVDNRVIFSVKTDNAGTSGTNQFTIPTIGGGYSYDIETSDGQTITGLTSSTTITFPSAGTYDIFITGAFPRFYFNNTGDKLKLIELKNFGTYAQGGTDQVAAFFGCSNLVISATDVGYFGSVTNFIYTWRDCSSLTSFPLIDTSSGTNFSLAWYNCSSLTSFPLIDTSSGTNLSYTWRNCTSLVTFPSNAFDSNIATNYTNAFANTNLSTQSIDDILVSLDACGVSNGTFTQSGGSTPSATGLAAKTNLINKGWTITTT